MNSKREVTFEIRQFGDDDSLASISSWQNAGPEEIWKATWELTVLSYALRGMDISHTPMRRDLFEQRKVPWLAAEGEKDSDE